MAMLETPWYLIDTDDFETVNDMTEMIHNIKDEANALCGHCSKCRKCANAVYFPEDHQDCLRREDYLALVEVIDAIRPYAATLTAGNVA
jgi:hypothetical protein